MCAGGRCANQGSPGHPYLPASIAASLASVGTSSSSDGATGCSLPRFVGSQRFGRSCRGALGLATLPAVLALLRHRRDGDEERDERHDRDAANADVHRVPSFVDCLPRVAPWAALVRRRGKTRSGPIQRVVIRVCAGSSNDAVRSAFPDGERNHTRQRERTVEPAGDRDEVDRLAAVYLYASEKCIVATLIATAILSSIMSQSHWWSSSETTRLWRAVVTPRRCPPPPP